MKQITRTEENAFYLSQIRKEETQLYFRRANQAMRDKNYSLASQLLARYKETRTTSRKEGKNVKSFSRIRETKTPRGENWWKSWKRPRRT